MVFDELFDDMLDSNLHEYYHITKKDEVLYD